MEIIEIDKMRAVFVEFTLAYTKFFPSRAERKTHHSECCR